MRKMYSENQIKKMSGEVASETIQEKVDSGELKYSGQPYENSVELVSDLTYLQFPKDAIDIIKNFNVAKVIIRNLTGDFIEFIGLCIKQTEGYFSGVGYYNDSSYLRSATIELDGENKTTIIVYNASGEAITFYEEQEIEIEITPII